MNCITKMFLLVSSSVSSTQLLCFVHGQGQKSEQKHITKKFVEFHNHFFLLTMRELRLLTVEPNRSIMILQLLLNTSSLSCRLLVLPYLDRTCAFSVKPNDDSRTERPSI